MNITILLFASCLNVKKLRKQRNGEGAAVPPSSPANPHNERDDVDGQAVIEEDKDQIGEDRDGPRNEARNPEEGQPPLIQNHPQDRQREPIEENKNEDNDENDEDGVLDIKIDQEYHIDYLILSKTEYEFHQFAIQCSALALTALWVNKKDDNACDYGAISGYNFLLSALICCFLLHVISSSIFYGLRIKAQKFLNTIYYFLAGILLCLSINLVSNILNESNCGF